MKNLSKRNKILFSVIGAVVVVVALGLALGLTGNLPLQGSSTTYIFPQNLCLLPGQSYNMRWNLTAAIVNWKVGDSTVVKLSNGSNKGVTATAQNKVGYITWVQGKTGMGFADTAEVAVWGMCPHKLTVKPGDGYGATHYWTGGTWSTSNPAVISITNTGFFKAIGTSGQSATITYTSPSGKASAVITIDSSAAHQNVDWLTMQ